MCGLVGFFTPRSFKDGAAVLQHMCSKLVHRGPDDSGYWISQDQLLGVAHRRLSILDLSPAGHQPMVSAHGHWVIVLNGEIYNHLALRKQLVQAGCAPNWRGHSDTETLLACVEAWGVEATLKATVGMFAFALWDKTSQHLILARDRLGEKPLYYGLSNGAVVFSSELKAVRAFPGFAGEIDRGALSLYMRHNTVSGAHCIYKGFAKLLPGTWLKVTSSDVASGHLPEPKPYWSALDCASEGRRSPLQFGTDAEAVGALEKLLREAIAGQMMADVPLGAFLSGGIDSSTIVALMQVQSSKPVRTFTIGFNEVGYDEAQHAKAVAKHLGTDHTELYVTPEDALGVIPKLPKIYDEPFADSSQIPTFIVAQMAQQHVTVALSGDAGDEIFGGYNNYFLANKLWCRFECFPVRLRNLMATLIHTLSPTAWNRAFAALAPALPKRLQLALSGDKLHKGAALLDSKDGADLYRRLVSHWEPQGVLLDGDESRSLIYEPWPELPTFFEQMMGFDSVTYLPDDILTKVDRAAMSVSFETRVPFLDHRVFEFAWRLPLHFKIRGGVGKWALRQVLYGHVPRTLIERPKAGFSVPIDGWLRGPLREWAEELLDESRLKRDGYFNPTPIRQRWQEHLSGQRNWQRYLWMVLMFQAWLESQKNG